LIKYKHIFNIKSRKEFEEITLQIFYYQAKSNLIYKQYLEYLGVNPSKVTKVNKIPFLPIDFFKYHKIVCSTKKEDAIFKSSGTSLDARSIHYITDLKLYEQSFNSTFKKFFGNIEDYCILGLLPSYLENGDSSLVYMTESLIKQSKTKNSGLYLNNYDELLTIISELETVNKKYIIIGVSYALLDLAEKNKQQLKKGIILETGGMKGRRKELPKEELHNILSESFGVETIYSEYGMTELLSQAYSFGKGEFSTPTWMKILIRDIYDPFTYLQDGKSGGINIIDLANINSCSFIETKDLGKININKSFSVLGRFDNSDIRGCNLLVE